MSSFLLGETSFAADPTSEPVVHQRRGGVLIGIALGPSLGVSRGYPNDARKIDRDEFFTDTGFSGGGALSLWLGVPFTDWLSFSLGAYGGQLYGKDDRTRSSALTFRIDAFPAWALGGVWRELGASLEAGVGLTSSAPREGGDDVIASGGASRFALGVFYEGIRAWKLSMGPFASADLMWSPSALRPLAWIGWRMALYTKP